MTYPNDTLTPPPTTRRLFRQGDLIEVQYLIYPGPSPIRTVGRVLKCLSPTYYEVEYMDHRQRKVTKRLKRGQLP